MPNISQHRLNKNNTCLRVQTNLMKWVKRKWTFECTLTENVYQPRVYLSIVWVLSFLTSNGRYIIVVCKKLGFLPKSTDLWHVLFLIRLITTSELKTNSVVFSCQNPTRVFHISFLLCRYYYDMLLKENLILRCYGQCYNEFCHHKAFSIRLHAVVNVLYTAGKCGTKTIALENVLNLISNAKWVREKL